MQSNMHSGIRKTSIHPQGFYRSSVHGFINGTRIDLDFFSGARVDLDFEVVWSFVYLGNLNSMLYLLWTHSFPPPSGTNFSLIALLISNMMYGAYGILFLLCLWLFSISSNIMSTMSKGFLNKIWYSRAWLNLWMLPLSPLAGWIVFLIIRFNEFTWLPSALLISSSCASVNWRSKQIEHVLKENNPSSNPQDPYWKKKNPC